MLQVAPLEKSGFDATPVPRLLAELPPVVGIKAAAPPETPEKRKTPKFATLASGVSTPFTEDMARKQFSFSTIVEETTTSPHFVDLQRDADSRVAIWDKLTYSLEVGTKGTPGLQRYIVRQGGKRVR